MSYEPGCTLSSSPAIRAILPASALGALVGAKLFSISILLAPAVGMYDPVLGPPRELAIHAFAISLMVGAALSYLFILLIGAPLASVFGNFTRRPAGMVVALVAALAISTALYFALASSAPTKEPTWHLFAILCGFSVPSALVYARCLRKSSGS